MTSVAEAPTKESLTTVLELVDRRREEFNTNRFVPKDVIAAFKAAGIYRAATPKRFGGDALPPGTFLRMIERISEVDGSAGWVASFGSSGVYLAALPLDTQKELYADGPDVVFAGGLFPLQARRRGGRSMSGHWRFASGCKGADLLGVGIGVGDSSSGKPRTAVLRPGQVEIVDNWDVVGMEGTGSHDLKVAGAVYPRSGPSSAAEPRTWTSRSTGTPLSPTPPRCWRWSTSARARRAGPCIRVGSGRTGSPARPSSPTAPTTGSHRQGRGRLRSARAFFYEATDEVYEAESGGEPATDELTSLLRLAPPMSPGSARRQSTAYTSRAPPPSTRTTPCSATCGTPRRAAARLPRRRHVRRRRRGPDGVHPFPGYV